MVFMFTNDEHLEQKFWGLQVYFQWGLYDKTIYIELASMPNVCSIVSPTSRVTWAQTFCSQDFLLDFFFFLLYFQRKKWKEKKKTKATTKLHYTCLQLQCFTKRAIKLNWYHSLNQFKMTASVYYVKNCAHSSF